MKKVKLEMSGEGGGGERLTEAVVGLGESNRVILAAQVQSFCPSSGRTFCLRLSLALNFSILW
jgi:hypothetical protein